MAKFNRITGFLPPHFIETVVALNPTKYAHLFDNRAETVNLLCSASSFNNPYHRFVGGGKSDIEIYDAKRGQSRPGTKARFEGEAPTSDNIVNNAYDFTAHVRGFLSEVYGRNGIDASGMRMVSTVHYGRKYNNAFWDGSAMTYGDGDGDIFNTFVLLDVCGHEIGHGVTEHAAGTEYYGQSGALNEHYSDVMGESIEMWVNKITVDKADWVVGNGIFTPGVKGVGIRHMLLPGTAYNDSRLGKDPQPDHMDRYVKMSGDNGGVHYNSGIPNRAFALFALSLGGYVWEKACKIWYAARPPAGRRPSFAQFAFHTIAACKALGYTSDVAKLEKAWKDVGVTPSATAIDTETPDLGGDVGHDHN
ncbi:MAG: M4 family metallopeptidase [Candidatus Obscuribacterales bacterium]|nr:M4 family metallopeptidase [Candidatus Obscuribacterales bacterium]